LYASDFSLDIYKGIILNYEIEHLAKAIKAARQRKALSQRELSVKAGIPQGQISRFERGDVDLRLSSLVTLARALDLEFELIPRKALPAVQSIVRSTERNDHSERALEKALEKASEIAQPPKPAYRLEQDDEEDEDA
jgi:transcriptional regulator with XRE-family HTH domain